jgi:hypothetical protein
MAFHKYLGDSKMFEYDKHYKECKQLNKPFIKAKINPRHGNYYVQIDLITCNCELTDKELVEIKKLFDKEIKFLNMSTDFTNFSIDNELAWFDGVSIEHLDDFCNSLYDLTQKYHLKSD